MSAPIRGERGLRGPISTRAAIAGLSIGIGFLIAAGSFQTFLVGAL